MALRDETFETNSRTILCIRSRARYSCVCTVERICFSLNSDKLFALFSVYRKGTVSRQARAAFDTYIIVVVVILILGTDLFEFANEQIDVIFRKTRHVEER